MSSDSMEVEVYLCPLHPGACRMANGNCERCGIPVRMTAERLARRQRTARLLTYFFAALGLMTLAGLAMGVL